MCAEKLPAVASASPKDVEVNSLILRLTVSKGMHHTSEVEVNSHRLCVFVRVCGEQKQYPGDVGVFCPFLLNCIVLEVGEAIFLPANEPHAYISGDCIGRSPAWLFCSLLCLSSHVGCMW